MLCRKPVGAIQGQRAQKPLWQPGPRCSEEAAPCNTNKPSAAAALRWRPLIPAPPCELQHSNTHTASGNGCYPPLSFYNQRNEIFRGLDSQCISPKYCCARLRGGDSDDSIKHMNEGNCHVDVAEHRRLMILNQGGAPLTGTLGIPAERLYPLICRRMALYDFKDTITVR